MWLIQSCKCSIVFWSDCSSSLSIEDQTNLSKMVTIKQLSNQELLSLFICVLLGVYWHCSLCNERCSNMHSVSSISDKVHVWFYLTFVIFFIFSSCFVHMGRVFLSEVFLVRHTKHIEKTWYKLWYCLLFDLMVSWRV